MTEDDVSALIKLAPKGRKDWRDPSMTCLRRMSDIHGNNYIVEADPVLVSRNSQKRIDQIDNLPRWQDDPTYDLRWKR